MGQSPCRVALISAGERKIQDRALAECDLVGGSAHTQERDVIVEADARHFRESAEVKLRGQRNVARWSIVRSSSTCLSM
jgi:hypothetical protein